MKTPGHELSASVAVAAITAGQLSSVDLVQSCLDRIAATDDAIGAWAHLDADAALAQAAQADEQRRGGYATGALHGVPVALKDIIDTADMPTARGTPIFAGRQPDRDALLVARLRDAGAVIMGKTVTTEMAFVHPSDTRNPHNPDRTPGGSSSGSAAAVAAGQVPLAVGTQTNGSVIRPASFCGTFGFKPTRGLIGRSGVLQTSVSLDQVGSFARTLDDAALLAQVMQGVDLDDPLAPAHPRPAMVDGARADAPVPPDLAWFDLPFNDRLSDAARDGLNGVLDILGPRVQKTPVAAQMADLVAVQATIHEYEYCLHLKDVIDGHWDALSPTLQPVITRGRAISTAQYQDALAVKTSAERFFADFFQDFDAIIAPAAAGEAPPLGPTTGDPVFCTLWTLAGLPCVTLPILVGETGLPIGVQLIGPAHRDDRLLRTARWLQMHLADAADIKET